MIINTTAPIAIEDLKKYFIDKSIIYVIDYDNSTLKEQKLLTYLGNLDIPSDINFDPTNTNHLTLLKTYLETSFLVNVQSLEYAAIDCMLEYKQLINTTVYSDFIDSNIELIKEWESRLDSLTLYNVWCLDSLQLKDWVETHPEDTSDSSKFINFVNLLKHDDFYQYFEAIDPASLKNYKVLFNEYCFKGKNLFNYWSTTSNPMFLLTWGIASGVIDTAEYIASAKHDTEKFLLSR
jgi:hypothetical protein